MLIPYDHMADPILSSINILCSPTLYKQELRFEFEEYVKCQLHMPILSKFFNRDIYAQLKAHMYITSKSSDISSIPEVLKWYYSDMLNMLVKLIKSKPDLDSSIIVQALLDRENNFPIVFRSISQVQKDLKKLLDSSGEYDTPYSAVLQNFSSKEISLLTPTTNLAMAAILSEMLLGNSVELLEVAQ